MFRKSALESAGPKRGAEESAEKALRALRLLLGVSTNMMADPEDWLQELILKAKFSFKWIWAKKTLENPRVIFGGDLIFVLRSRPPFTGVLYGEYPKVLRRVLSECFFRGSQKVPQGVLPRVLFLVKEWGKVLSGGLPSPGLSREHSPGHFLGVPKRHFESTRWTHKALL